MAPDALIRRLGALAAAVAAWLAPAAALACPQCATGSGGGPARTIALGAFIMLPFAVTGAILKIIRAERSSTGGDPAGGAINERPDAKGNFRGPAPALDTARRRVE